MQELSAENTALRATVSQVTERAGGTVREMQKLRDTKLKLEEEMMLMRRQITDAQFQAIMSARDLAAPVVTSVDHAIEGDVDGITAGPTVVAGPAAGTAQPASAGTRNAVGHRTTSLRNDR